MFIKRTVVAVIAVVMAETSITALPTALYMPTSDAPSACSTNRLEIRPTTMVTAILIYMMRVFFAILMSERLAIVQM
jgi:hypothetical protein